MSLRLRLTLALAAFSIVPLAASMGVGFYQTRAALLASEQRRLEALATLKAAQLRTQVDFHTRDVQRLRNEFTELEIGRDAAVGSKAWSVWIRAATASVDTSTDLAVLDLMGNVVTASRPMLTGQNWSSAPGIAAGRLRTRTVGPHRQNPGSAVVEDAVYAPLHRDGVTVAQLAVVGSPVALRSWLEHDLPPGATAAVTGLGGKTLASWPPENADSRGTGSPELVSAHSELYPGGAELTVAMPVERVLRPFLFLRNLGIAALVVLMIGAVAMAMMMARRIVTREQMLQNRLIHQEKLAAVGSLAAGVAHEIGNPLASLSSLVQVRLRHTSDGAQRADLELLLDHVDRINRTVKGLTRAARGSGGGKRPVLLQDLAVRAVELVRHDPRARGVELEALAGPSALPLLLDEDTWLQVLMNLLVNALDAVSGVAEARITVSVATENQSVVLDVSDNGCGMSADVLSRATDPLFTTKAPGSGTGLGLHLVAELVEQYRGRLTITSEVGRGTSVRIEMPATLGRRLVSQS
jgi:signal transduction histidine kinase